MSVDCDDGEPVSCYTVTHPQARLEHKCDACCETIRPGDVYANVFFICEGYTNRLKRCARCEVLYRKLVTLHQAKNRKCLHDDTTTVDPELDCGHTYREVFGEDAPEELARLAFMTPSEMQAELAKGTT